MSHYSCKFKVFTNVLSFVCKIVCSEFLMPQQVIFTSCHKMTFPHGISVDLWHLRGGSREKIREENEGGDWRERGKGNSVLSPLPLLTLSPATQPTQAKINFDTAGHYILSWFQKEHSISYGQNLVKKGTLKSLKLGWLHHSASTFY